MSKNLDYFLNALDIAKRFVFLFTAFLITYFLELLSFGYDPTRLINLVENIAFSSNIFFNLIVF